MAGSPHARGRLAPVASLTGIRVVYGSTVAVDGLDLDIRPGEVIGLVGANGAGKSTLMRVLGGATRPRDGTLTLDGTPLGDAYSPRAAQAAGIRTVWQELSLCANLTVAENLFVEQPAASPRRFGWRRDYARRAETAIEDIFPGSGIRGDHRVGGLAIGQRQMVEIARAASAPGLRLLILDEPSSSLDAERSVQLRAHLRRRAGDGLAVIFISHKLSEVLDIAHRIFVMRNGRPVLDAPATELDHDRLVAVMGGSRQRLRRGHGGRLGPALLTLEDPAGGPGLALHAGEIVGIAGLEGEGQRALLAAIHHGRAPAARQAASAHVSGDRTEDGVFPLWSVEENISIGRIARRAGLAPVSARAERAALLPAAQALDLDPARFASGILDLSGGNQQKALGARALSTDARILILDDPTRGVDIGTKERFWRMAREVARSGKLVVWHSTEDAEFAVCDRVLVIGGGRVAAELGHDEISEDRIVAEAFAARTGAAATAAGRSPLRRLARHALENAALLGLVLVAAALVSLNPLVASVFGMELLLGPAVALTLIALAQMFIVGGSEVDLGIGSFAGLVNVLGATLLVASPPLGLLALATAIGGYALMAVLIRTRAIPAIVVTLGASFVWYGIGTSIQPTPGGAAPGWLRALTQWSIPGLPTPLVLIVVPALVAVLIHRSRTGTVLRGFGANPASMTRSGWPILTYSVLRYVIAGGFATCGGLAITSMNGASDINAGSGYTLLSVAAVVLGGCRLFGGVISPVGVAAGAVTLSLIGALLGSLGVSTDFNAAVQGLLLIAILGLRGLGDSREVHG